MPVTDGKYANSIKWKKWGDKDQFFEIVLREKVSKQYYTVKVLRFTLKNYHHLYMMSERKGVVDVDRVKLRVTSLALALNKLMRPRYTIMWKAGDAPIARKREVRRKLDDDQRRELQDRTRRELERTRLEVTLARERRLTAEAEARKHNDINSRIKRGKERSDKENKKGGKLRLLSKTMADID